MNPSKAIYSTLAAIAIISLAVTFPVLAQDSGEPSGGGEAAAGAESIELKDPVAVVNGRNISSAELKQSLAQQLSRAGRSLDQLPARMQLMGYHQALDEIIIDDLLTEKSQDIEVDDAEVEQNVERFKSQFPSEEEMQQVLERNGETIDDLKEAIRENLKKREWITSRISDDVEVGDEEVRAFYEQNKTSFNEPEMVRASHILLTTPEDLSDEEVAEKKRAIENLKQRVDEGEDFGVLAKEFSEDPGTKDKGGDLDFFSRERMVPEFAEAAFAAETGTVTDPVKTQFGYHIIKVTDRKQARAVPFEEAKPQIESFLENRKRQQQVQQLLTALKQQAEVKINLPPKPAAPVAPQPPTAAPQPGEAGQQAAEAGADGQPGE